MSELKLRPAREFRRERCETRVRRTETEGRVERSVLVTGLKTGHYRPDVMRDVVSFLGNSVRENG
jgi:hypothetical protein